MVTDAKQNYGSALQSLYNSVSPSPSASSFCESRSKFSSHWIEDIRDEVLDEFDSHSKSQSWHGYQVYAVDGSKLALPRELFAHGFKAPSGGFCPQGLISALVRTKDKLIYDIKLTSNENERTAAHEHLEKLSKGDLVIYDRGYLCFSLLIAHFQSGVHGVFRVQKGGAFVEVEKFWRGRSKSKIVIIDPSPPTYRSISNSYPELEATPVKVRLIKYTVEKETYVLATTLIDNLIPVKSFAALYPERWFSEEVYKGLKKTLGFENLHSKKLNGIEQEIQASALLWNLAQISIEICKDQIQKTRQDYQANRKQTVLFLANHTVEIFSTFKNRLWNTWNNLVRYITKMALPIRNGRKFPRQSLKPPSHWKKPKKKEWIPKGRPRGRPKLGFLTE